MPTSHKFAVDFASLVAPSKGDGHLVVPLKNINGHVYNLLREAIRLLDSDASRKATFAPYIGRAILESALTAILFRSDPFRAITLMKFQSSGDFDHNSNNSISISWANDIVCHEQIKHPWKAGTQPGDVSRALFSPYTDEAIWRPAFDGAVDHMQRHHPNASFPTLLANDSEKVIGIVKGQARQLYSFWSKGIHGEFFAMGGTNLDAVTCDEKLKRSIDIVLDLAYASHFISTSSSRYSASSAANRYMTVKGLIHG